VLAEASNRHVSEHTPLSSAIIATMGAPRLTPMPGETSTTGHVLLYDGDCGLCRTILAGILAIDRRHALRPLALQTPQAAAMLPELSEQERLASIHLVDPDGRVSSAGVALADLTALLPGGRAPAALLRAAPGATEWGYRQVADHRHRLGRLIPGAVRAHATRRVRQAEAGLTPRPTAVSSRGSEAAPDPGSAARPPARRRS
jgi:predicted DCC family thiol-disulfide oxidoreductase YuxK